jgi:hypothetical protein
MATPIDFERVRLFFFGREAGLYHLIFKEIHENSSNGLVSTHAFYEISFFSKRFITLAVCS